MNPSLTSLLAEIRFGLETIYAQRLKGVYLFGSYARGDADRESDLDILVILGDFDHYAEEVDRTGHLIAELSLKYCVSITEVFIKENEWFHGDTPFLLNVRDEAIPV